MYDIFELSSTWELLGLKSIHYSVFTEVFWIVLGPLWLMHNPHHQDINHAKFRVELKTFHITKAEIVFFPLQSRLVFSKWMPFSAFGSFGRERERAFWVYCCIVWWLLDLVLRIKRGEKGSSFYCLSHIYSEWKSRFLFGSKSKQQERGQFKNCHDVHNLIEERKNENCQFQSLIFVYCQALSTCQYTAKCVTNWTSSWLKIKIALIRRWR